MKLSTYLLLISILCITSCINLDETEWDTTVPRIAYHKSNWHNEREMESANETFPYVRDLGFEGKYLYSFVEGTIAGGGGKEEVYNNNLIEIDSLGKQYIQSFICEIKETPIEEFATYYDRSFLYGFQFVFTPDHPILKTDKVAIKNYFENIDASQVLFRDYSGIYGVDTYRNSDKNYQKIYQDKIAIESLDWYNDYEKLVLTGFFSASIHYNYLDDVDRYHSSSLYEGTFLLKIDTN